MTLFISMTNKHKKGKLFLFTYAYPYGNAESFLVNELPFLKDFFSKIHVIPEQELTALREMPSDFYLQTFTRKKELPLRRAIIKYGFSVLKILLFSLLFNKNKAEVKFYTRRIKVRLLDLLVEFYNANRLINVLKENGLKEHDVIYCYWMLDNARLLSWAKQKKMINNKIVTRVHGFDYRFEQNPKGFFPYRQQELKGYDTIAPVSNYAKNYLSEKYRISKEKMITYRLGVTENVSRNLDKVNNSSTLNFISCSYIIPRKRVDWIFQALYHFAKENTEYQINWCHIGDGESMTDLMELINKAPISNLQINLLGNLKNQKILSLYGEENFDAFIHCAEGEGGCAVAIQEAFASKTPTICIANGGVIEMVNSNNSCYAIGKPDDDSSVLHDLVEQFISFPMEKRNKMKLAAYNTWEQFFNAEKNYKQFIKEQL